MTYHTEYINYYIIVIQAEVHVDSPSFAPV